MSTFTKKILSASADGKAIKVAATGTARKLTIEWGAAAAPDNLIEITIPAEAGLVLVSPGLLIQGNATALTVAAFAASANVVTIHGFVNEIAP